MEEKIIITSDSTCDLSPELIVANDIRIFPLRVILGSETYRDGIDITPQEIFAYVEKTGVLPKTSAPNTEDYLKCFAPLVEEGNTVIHFNISSGASASHDFASAAAREIGKNIFVVDSHALSTGQGLLVMKACDLRAEGRSAQSIYDTVNGLREKVNTSFIPDTLDYLYKGGRCSALSYYGSKVLSIHPQIAMKGGKLYPKAKYIGSMTRCLKKYVSDLAEEYSAYDATRCFITHSNADPELVARAKELTRELFRFNEVIETVAGSIITSHCGRNTIGVLFIGE